MFLCLYICVGFVAVIAIGSTVGSLLLLTLLVTLVNFISIFVWLKKRKQKACTVAANVVYRQRQSVDSESVSLSNNDYEAVNVDEISSGYKLNTQQPHAEVDELLYDSPEDPSTIVNYQTLTRGRESILSDRNDIIHIKPNVAYRPTIIQMCPNAAYASAEELQSVEELEISREEHEYDYVIQI